MESHCEKVNKHKNVFIMQCRDWARKMIEINFNRQHIPKDTQTINEIIKRIGFKKIVNKRILQVNDLQHFQVCGERFCMIWDIALTFDSEDEFAKVHITMGINLVCFDRSVVLKTIPVPKHIIDPVE